MIHPMGKNDSNAGQVWQGLISRIWVSGTGCEVSSIENMYFQVVQGSRPAKSVGPSNLGWRKGEGGGRARSRRQQGLRASNRVAADLHLSRICSDGGCGLVKSHAICREMTPHCITKLVQRHSGRSLDIMQSCEHPLTALDPEHRLQHGTCQPALHYPNVEERGS